MGYSLALTTRLLVHYASECCGKLIIIWTLTTNSYNASTNGDGTLTDVGDVIITTSSITLTDAQARAMTVLNATGTASNDVIVGGVNDDTISGGNGNDTITGGAGADLLTGGAGADRFVYTEFDQGGNVIAGNAATPLTAGDVITDFETGVDKINVSAVATKPNATWDGTGASNRFFSSVGPGDSVGVITVDFDFSAAPTTSAVIDAITAGYPFLVEIGAGDIAYFAILDAGAAGTADDFYNIFAVQNTTGVDLDNAALKAAGVNVTLVASTAAGGIVVAIDFIV